MRKRKNLLLAAVSMMMVVALSACGKSANNSSPSSNAAQEAATEAKAEDEKTEDAVVLQIGIPSADDSLWAVLARRWSELAAEESGGRLKLDVYTSNQLGSQTDLLDQMLAGANVIGIGTAPYFADLGLPDFSIIQAPYLVNSWDDMLKITHSDWWAEQSSKLEEKGIKIISFNVQQGQRHTLSTKPIQTLEDFKGKKLRTPSGTLYIKTYEALGASPTPMDLGEVYTGLQQGTIDGEDNTLMTMYSEKHYEVAKYLILDGHIWDLQGLVMSTAVFNSLSPELQEILVSTCDQASDEFNESIDEENAKYIQDMKDAGVTVTEEIDFDAFAAAARKFYDYPEFDSWSDGLYDKMQEIINN